MKELEPSFCGFYFFEPFTITIKLLSEYFNDEYEWLEYFIWERDWLKNLKYGDVTVHGVPVDLSDWGKVYDFLMEGKK